MESITPSASAGAPPPPYKKLTEHRFSINDAKRGEWASITVLSRATGPENRPGYLTTDSIKGSVSVKLDKERRFDKVVVSVSHVYRSWIKISDLGRSLSS